MYLPYGIDEQGQLVHVESIGCGRTTLKCPSWAIPMIARKGMQVTPHFAHYGTSCREMYRVNDTIKLTFYGLFQFRHLGKVLEALRRLNDENDGSSYYWLEDYGAVKLVDLLAKMRRILEIRPYFIKVRTVAGVLIRSV